MENKKNDLNSIKNDVSFIKDQILHLSDLPASINNLMNSMEDLFNILKEIREDINNQEGKVIILKSFENKIQRLERTVEVQKKWAKSVNNALIKAWDDFADI